MDPLLASPGRLDRRSAARVAVGALAVSNVLVNRVLPERAYVPWNASLATGLVGLARAAGVDDELGLGRTGLGRGLTVGATAAGIAAAGLGVAATVGDHGALHDRRASELDAHGVRHQAVVRIPFGTVVLEEVAFRGVLPALLSPSGRRRPVGEVGAALLFGLWHVLPSRELVADNEAVGRVASRVGVAGMRVSVVLGSAAAGLGFQALRRQGGHLAAPLLAHWALNALGVVAVHVVGRRARAAGTS